MEIPTYPDDEDMTFTKYQRTVLARAKYPNVGDNITYPTLGLCGESGEFAEKLKKSMRDKDGELSPDDRLAMAKELGDVLWYVAACARELGYTLQNIAELNMEKTAGRLERGTIHGDGDDR